jgi:membrane protein implicated in regulation of membrane protease activity
MNRPRLTVLELVIVIIVCVAIIAARHFFAYTYTWQSLLFFAVMALLVALFRPRKRAPGEHPHSMPRSKHFDR